MHRYFWLSDASPNSMLHRSSLTKQTRGCNLRSYYEPTTEFTESSNIRFLKIVTIHAKQILRPIHCCSVSRSMRIRQVLKSIRAFPLSPNTGSYQVQFSPEGSSSGDIITFSFLSNETSYYPRTAAYQHQVLHQNRPQQLLEV